MPNTKVTAIAADLKSALLGIYGNKFKSLMLFGSHARGEAHKNSDIDFLVILKSARGKFSPGKEIERMNDAIYDIIIKHDETISVIPVSEEQYHNSSNPLYINVKNEGIAA